MDALDFVSKNDTLIALSLFSLLIIVLFVYLSRQPKKTVFEVVIQKPTELLKIIRSYKKGTEKFSILDGVEVYEGSIKDCWIYPLNWIDKNLSRIDAKYLALFIEPQPDPKKKGSILAPECLSIPVQPANDSDILWRVKKYRGVDKAIESQFKQSGGLGIPSWALILIVLVVIAGAAIAAQQAGIIHLGGL